MSISADSFSDKHPIYRIWLCHLFHNLPRLLKVWWTKPCFKRPVQIVTLRTINKCYRAIGVTPISRQKTISYTSLELSSFS
jgi:hypothetical protein